MRYFLVAGLQAKHWFIIFCPSSYSRAVGRSENPGLPVLFGGHNLPPLVEIGLTDLPKSGGTMALPTSPGTTPLTINSWHQILGDLKPGKYLNSITNIAKLSHKLGY